MDELEKLWIEAGLRSIECKQFIVTRTFSNFKELWDLTTKSPAFSGVLDNLTPQVISDIHSTVVNQLTRSPPVPVNINAHANAINGILLIQFQSFTQQLLSKIIIIIFV
jgi:hypothetical protein